MTPQSWNQPKFPAHSIKSIKLQNILSFGPEGMELELKPLNVLIGANASGKSNLLEVINLLRSMPTDPHTIIAAGGGPAEWEWKGRPQGGHGDRLPRIVAELTGSTPDINLEYSFELRLHHGGPPIFLQERLEDAAPSAPHHVHFSVHDFDHVTAGNEEKGGIDTNYSVLTQLKDPVAYPQITYVGRLLSQFRLYRDWQFGPAAEIRRPQRSQQNKELLAEDAGNLALVLEELERAGLKHAVLERLGQVYDGIEDISIQRPAGFVVFLVHEQGLKSPTPPERLSDGTLRYLCLLSILCHPEPPPLICMEEPELGLHPDALASVAEMLIEASTRCQLIVTTHSPDLIDALSDVPESVVVCERTEAGSQMQRLDPGPLKKWIEEYRLGGAWKTGIIGGRR